MKLLKKLGLAIMAIGLLQSCLTIEENYTFKKDGSGSMEYVIDMSELGEMMKDFDDSDGKIKNEQKSNIDSFATVLSSMDGIQNIKTDDQEWIQKISFDFKDINILNKALAVITEQGASWTNKGKKWTRTQGKLNNETIGQDEEGDDEEDDMFDFGSEMLASLTYRVNVTTSKSIKGFKGHETAEATIE